MRKNGKGTYRDDGDRTCSVCKRAKQGNQRFPEKPRKPHYKKRGWVVKKAARKKKETQERRNSPGKTIKKSVQKEKILRKKKQVLLPGIL